MKRYKSISPDATEIIKKAFALDSVFIKTDSNIVFLCGKRIIPGEFSARGILLNYAQKHFDKFLFFLAEDFFEAYPDSPLNDLLSIEHYLSKYSDCIIIILESESAFAELGAFSIVDPIAKNLIVINDRKYSTDKSFINLGPIKKVNKFSRFGHIINTDFSTISLVATEIENKLQVIEKRNRTKIKIKSSIEFDKIDNRIKLFLLLDFITLFEPLNHKELIELLIELFGPGKYDIHFEIGLLQALKLIARKDDFYLRNMRELKFYFDFANTSSTTIKSLNMNHIHKYNLSKLSTLKKKDNGIN